MYPVLKIMHMLNFLDTFSMGITGVGINEANDGVELNCMDNAEELDIPSNSGLLFYIPVSC